MAAQPDTAARRLAATSLAAVVVVSAVQSGCTKGGGSR
jgi:hypothetical protein